MEQIDLMETITEYIKSQDAFPVDFEAFWQWCGFARKDSAKRTLEKNFAEGVDYILHKLVDNKPISKSNPQLISLTIDCAKVFAMLAQTEKGREVRLYFLECEKQLQALTSKKGKLEILRESVQTLIDHEERITDLEQERERARDYLEQVNQDPAEALFVDTRRALDHIIKSYSLANGVEPEVVYATFYRQFSLRYQMQLYHLAGKAGKTPIAYLESRGYIVQAYELAKELFTKSKKSGNAKKKGKK